MVSFLDKQSEAVIHFRTDFKTNLAFSDENNQQFSYVMINPPYDMHLKMNDIM